MFKHEQISRFLTRVLFEINCVKDSKNNDDRFAVPYKIKLYSCISLKEKKRGAIHLTYKENLV